MKSKDMDVRFEGYWDGYKAGNIASAGDSIGYHIGRIITAVDDLAEHWRQTGKIDASQELATAASYLRNPESKLLSNLVGFGEALRTTLKLLPNLRVYQLTQLASAQLRKIVVHYLEIAQDVEDNRIMDLAVAVGHLFEQAASAPSSLPPNV
jgi:hypothetical protein